MSETSENFRAYDAHKREQRGKRRSAGAREIENLARSGRRVMQLTDFQYRIDGRIDLYPTNGKWHNLETGKRGRYQSARRVVNRELGESRP